MRSTIAFSLLGLSSLASAVTFSETICLTQYGGSSISPVPSKTTTSSTSYTATLKTTITSTSTVTPAPVSKTRTVFTKSTSTTTVYKTTDTFSTTTTEYYTSWFYVLPTTTITSTRTTTSTSYLSTLTIGTSSGLVPIQSYISSLGYTPGKRHALAIDDALLARAVTTSATPRDKVIYGADGQATYSPARYPTQVSCTAKIQVINVAKVTSTAAAVATRTAPTSTATVTTTSTIVSMKTSNGGTASTTVTSTITSTIVSAETDTVTSIAYTFQTESAVGPMGTEYAACKDPGNYLQSIAGAYLMGEEDSAWGTHQVAGQNVLTAQDCCNLCESLGDSCATWYWPGPQYLDCYMQTPINNVCNATSPVIHITSYGGERFHNATAGNSDCGRYTHDPWYDQH